MTCKEVTGIKDSSVSINSMLAVPIQYWYTVTVRALLASIILHACMQLSDSLCVPNESVLLSHCCVVPLQSCSLVHSWITKNYSVYACYGYITIIVITLFIAQI